jgi:tetratricopeptide (TPR) repeat protein
VKAWRLLYKAAEYEIDNRNSETLASRIVTCWQANQKISDILKENQQLERARERHERAIRVEEASNQRNSESSRVTGVKKDNDSSSKAFQQPSAPPPPSISASAPSVKRLMEAEAKMKVNEASSTLSRQTLKLEFQALILQYFAQRRFQHVTIANDFYRYIFAGEEQTLEGAGVLRSGITGLDTKVTTAALQSLTNEAIRDVNSGIAIVDYHLERGELQAATERLQEAYFLGEFVPSVQTFPRDKKQRLTEFVRTSGQLLTALEVRDLDQASSLLLKLGVLAKDFNPAKPRAMIEGAKQISNLTLKRALVAAQTGDVKAAQDFIQQAVQTWPNNPEIEKVTDSLFAKADLKTNSALDFDRYLNQKDFRAIFNDRFRLGTALATDETRGKQLIEVMRRMEKIEIAIAQAKEFDRTANKYGAWEVLERVYGEFPEDSELNRLRADYAVGALDYAGALNTANKAFARKDFGTAMVLYLKAMEVYPAGLLANDAMKAAALAYLEAKKVPGPAVK